MVKLWLVEVLLVGWGSTHLLQSSNWFTSFNSWKATTFDPESSFILQLETTQTTAQFPLKKTLEASRPQPFLLPLGFFWAQQPGSWAIQNHPTFPRRHPTIAPSSPPPPASHSETIDPGHLACCPRTRSGAQPTPPVLVERLALVVCFASSFGRLLKPPSLEEFLFFSFFLRLLAETFRHYLRGYSCLFAFRETWEAFVGFRGNWARDLGWVLHIIWVSSVFVDWFARMEQMMPLTDEQRHIWRIYLPFHKEMEKVGSDPHRPHRLRWPIKAPRLSPPDLPLI